MDKVHDNGDVALLYDIESNLPAKVSLTNCCQDGIVMSNINSQGSTVAESQDNIECAKCEETISEHTATECTTSTSVEKDSLKPPQTLILRVDDIVSEVSETISSVGFLSPLTPSSQFKKCWLDNANVTPLWAAVLCYWDNIVGPKVRYLWLTKQLCPVSLTMDLLGFLAHYTVSGDIERDPSDPRVELKFYVSADKGVAVIALVFGAAANVSSRAVHSLSIIAPYTEHSEFLKWKDLYVDWLHRIIPFLRLHLATDGENAFDWFKSHFNDVVDMIASLRECPLSRHVQLKETYLDHLTEVKFIQRAIAAHLFQCQRTLVIGEAVNQINIMLRSLSLFTNRRFLHRCCYLTQHARKYCPELSLQGLLQFDDVSQVYHSMYPTAIVNVTSRQVWVTCSPQDYLPRRDRFIVSELQKLWSADQPNNNSSLQFSDVFEPMDYTESLVDDCLQQMIGLPLAQGTIHVRQFMASLERHAVAAIEYLNSYMSGTLGASLLPKLKTILSLPHAADVLIVLATADRLKPGILRYIH